MENIGCEGNRVARLTRAISAAEQERVAECLRMNSKVSERSQQTQLTHSIEAVIQPPLIRSRHMGHASSAQSHRAGAVQTTVAVLLCAFNSVVAADDSAGELVSRGTGPGADGHRLPQRAIDNDELPHTMLAERDRDDDRLPLYRLAPNTYFLYGNIAQIDNDNRGWNGNAGFVVTDEGVVVIDALGTPKLGQRLIATIRSVTDKPIRYLVITHNHPDHAYGASAFRAMDGVRIVAHAGMVEYLGSQQYQASVDYRRNLLKVDMAGFVDVKPDIAIGGPPFAAQRVRLGQYTFDIYNVGAHHSHGDLVVHQVEDDIVWISDLAFNQRTTFMGDGSSKQAIAAQSWLLDTFANAKLMVPGHGSAQTPRFPMVTATRDYMEQLRETMGRMIDEGVDLYEAVNRSDLPEWHDTRLYEENHRANANFVYREMERELFE
ncbi:MAG: hypothetical protein AMJ69_02535 [Gammaproteobacteria bacterium SG8_47]|nr:MAG: hypothetical protein AMJ69_02535 [Gammaproteobacteria bacterium SG8_47]